MIQGFEEADGMLEYAQKSTCVLRLRNGIAGYTYVAFENQSGKWESWDIT